MLRRMPTDFRLWISPPRKLISYYVMNGSSTNNVLFHSPVLYQEIIHALRPKKGGSYVDCTLGAGGHAWGILQMSSPDGRLLGLDVDPKALEIAQHRLMPFGGRVVIKKTSYVALKQQLDELGWSKVDGVLLDLGLSSMQLDVPARGFSFQADAPLDMRFDPNSPVRAHDLINELPERELADLIYKFGEERKARKIAKAIVEARPLSTTLQLADVVSRAVGKGGRNRRNYRRHPATLTFQALRIAVNRELEALEQVLPQALDVLVAGGRLAVISFHSLEDRIVKRYFRRESKDCICPSELVVCNCEHKAIVIEINRKPVRPCQDEVAQNPRARSARLRVVEKIS